MFDSNNVVARIGRRGFLRASAMGSVAASVYAAEPPQNSSAHDVTRRLAGWVVASSKEDVPPQSPIRREALRTLVNWIGCAIGGSRPRNR